MTIFEINILWFHIAPSYYWLMYAIWFIIWYYYLLKKNIVKKNELEDLFFYIFIWVVLWWRLWYILFYDLSYYINSPLNIIKVWEWWMSFHWWFLWVVFMTLYFAKKYKLNFWKIIDELAVIVTIGLFLWRIGNFLNKELLWYSWYNWPLKVMKLGISYFPSPLIEALLEWIILFLILYFINKNKSFYWKTSAYFLIFYSIFRIFVEVFFRTPDIQIWYIFWFLTMWVILSLPMLLLWIILLIILRKNEI